MTTPKFSILSVKGGHPILITADGVRVQTPPVEDLIFYVGVGALAAAEIIEWPVALVLTAGHLLVGRTTHPGFVELGEALSEA